MRIPVTGNHSFEYMMIGGWSDGAVNNTEQKFMNYVIEEALKYNNPLEISIGSPEKK